METLSSVAEEAADVSDSFFSTQNFAAEISKLEDSKPTASPSSTESKRQESSRKLQSLQEKLNLGRAKAKEARDQETRNKQDGPNAIAREEIRDAKAREKRFYEGIAAQGEDPDRFWRLQQTQDAVEKKAKTEKRKRETSQVDRALPLFPALPFLRLMRTQLTEMTRYFSPF